jgi:murein DD-endopeptidase MepM/ murein hydrolase activator NlpD
MTDQCHGIFWRVSLMLAACSALSAQAPVQIGVTAAARSIRPGELVVLTLAAPGAIAPRVRAFDRDLAAFPVRADSWRVLVGIDLATAPGTYQVEIGAGSGSPDERATHVLVVKARAFPTRTVTVAPGFVNPPPEAVVRIQQEAQELEQLWRSSTSPRLWAGAFVRPVADPANSAFGARSIFNGQPRSPHGGADFLSAAGTPIKAPNAGRIALARDLYFTGNTVVIDHGLGLFSLFAHLSEVSVQAGADVATGEVVGRVGATGRVSGPHLHWTVRAGGARVDPLSLLAVLGTKSLIPGP